MAIFWPEDGLGIDGISKSILFGVYIDPIPFNFRTDNEIARHTVNTPPLVIVAILSAEKWNIVTEIKIQHSFHCAFIQRNLL
jgi:hypothetical protein